MINITKDIKMLKMYFKKIEEEIESLEQEKDKIKIYTISRKIGEIFKDLNQIIEIIQTKLN